MAVDLLSELAAYVARDRARNIIDPASSLARDGVALFADISGFTALTEALTRGLKPDQGAEELTRALELVFAPIIGEVHAFGGSVIKFGGDALTVWFGRARRGRKSAVVRRAVSAAWQMQRAIAVHGQVATPIGTVTLKMKIGLAYGLVKRFSLGLAEYGYEDVLAGATLDRMVEAEHHAEPGEILADRDTIRHVHESVSIGEWRGEFGVVDNIRKPAQRQKVVALLWPAEKEEPILKELSPYVPRQVYETLLTGRVQLAELKPVVSLFVQFHGLDYDRDPAIAEKLQTYFVMAQRVVERYDGRLNRLITGDKGSLLHIIFGAPRSVEEQEARAVRCALDLQKECGQLPFIEMQRVGVAMGRAFAGPVGSRTRHEYTTMGDAINLSARLMQSAADHQVLIESTVRNYLGPEFEVEQLADIMVKGKLEPIAVFAAHSVLASYHQPQRRYLPRIFGREAELSSLQQRVSALSAGQGSVVFLLGDVGMGKSLLLDTLRFNSEVTWASGISLAYGQSLSGYLFIDLIRDLLDLSPGAGPDQASYALSQFCRDLFGEERLEATYPYIARFMGLPLEAQLARRLDGLSGESVRWQIFRLLPEMCRLLSSRRPTVLALDDLQWADATSQELVEALLPVVAQAPILLILSMRREQSSRAWALYQETMAQHSPGREHISELILHPLSDASAAVLVAHHAANLPQHIIQHLIQKAGGNPLFLVEMIRTLQMRGLLDAGVDFGKLGDDALDLPDSVQGLLLAQLDRLTVESRHTLQMASVIGRTFLHKVLSVIAGAEQQLSALLADIERRDYIHPADDDLLGLAHVFRHILIQESAYSTLLYERRREYHRQVARALERLFPSAIAEQSAFLSYHYERAGDLDQAIYYLLQTADRSRLLYAHEEAESLYWKALALIEERERRDGQPATELSAKTWLKIAQTRANSLDFETAQSYYERAFDLLDQLEAQRGGPAQQMEAGSDTIFRWGILQEYMSRFDPGLADVEQTSDIIYNLFEGLLELDSEWNVMPALARRWQIDDGGRRYRFELRPDTAWSDGAPLTAHDFVFAWRRNLDPKTNSGLAYALYVVEGAEGYHTGAVADSSSVAIRAVDDLTLEITLRAPVSYLPYLLADHITFPLPAHVVETAGGDQVPGKDWSLPEHLVCNGPFMLETETASGRLQLVRNPHYRGFAPGNLEKVELFPSHPALERYVEGLIDWCRVDDQPDILNRYPAESHVVQGFVSFLLGFACHFPPFDNPLARRAMAHSIDQQALVAAVWSGVQRPGLGGLIPPGMPGHSPELTPPFDPSLAQELMRQASTEGTSWEGSLKIVAFPGFLTTPQYLQDSWRQHLGIESDFLGEMPAEAALTSLSEGSAHMVLFGASASNPDADDLLRGIFHSASPANYFNWQDPQFDRLVAEASGLSSQRERLALYHEADRILVSEAVAVVPLYYLQAFGLMRPQFSLEGSGRILRGSTIKFKNIQVNQ